ncbi:TMV resistance protein N-like [Capsicum annuum]|uniref:TMV resistance protein N-like n=1 Tax=Capsicum annuum TaxID=4072 RepID=UPI001FB18219|nr:TMV resistance protein N-like [Capsicum annuum]
MAIYGIGVGGWGGGVGKSTLAKTAYNFNFNKYDGSSFLADVNKTSERHDGLVCLQRQLLSNVLGKKAENIYNVDNGVIKIQEAIQCRIILLVLDDVDDSDHLNAVLGMREGFIQMQNFDLCAHERCCVGSYQEADAECTKSSAIRQLWLGDIVLFCNRERMKIGDHEDLFDVFLNNRVDVFASFLSPNNG